MKRALAIALGFAAVLGVMAWKSLPPRLESPLTGQSMGTTWTLAWRGKPPERLRQEVSDVLSHWEQVLSSWREDSDLSRFNRGAAPSDDLLRVLGPAREIRDASGGAFDPAVLAQVHAAGCGPPGTGMDLSAIGKGFAVDRVGEKLRALGLDDFVFELGGEVLTGDGNWQVDIENPDPVRRFTQRRVTLKNQAIATSGNYHQPNHIIDPRSGRPVVRGPSSVSVIAADCATADAWATALFVLGPEFKDFPAGLRVTWQWPSDTAATPGN